MTSAAFILGLLLILLAVLYFKIPYKEKAPTYSEIISQFENNQVSSFVLDVGKGEIQVTTKGVSGSKKYKMPYYRQFLDDLPTYAATYNEENPESPMVYNFKQSGDTSLWLSVIPIVLMVGIIIFFIYYFMMAQSNDTKGALNVGKAKVTSQPENAKKATFKDVAGADEEKEELQEIVQFLKEPDKFNALGARIPHGILLVGPPGTGKTLLARACAGEAQVPFYSISGSDFVEMYVGVGASRVRDLFEKAKKTAPSIIFIDEIDAVGRQRGAGLGGGHDEREQTLNQLLVEMDGFTGNEGVIVIAATNRADILDKALLRPGRFDRTVYVGYPDAKGREEILKVHTKNKPLASDVDLTTVAKTTIGFTGADLENLVNEAALLAARNKRKEITNFDIEESSIKVIAGPEKKSRVILEKERRLTAFHEAGHAITAYYCKSVDPVQQITIIPRGPAGGMTIYRPEDDSQFVTKKQMSESLIMMLGGRVAEKLALDDISTGASNDLERATKTARAMVTQYGFSDTLGPVVYSADQETFMGKDFGSSRNYSEEIAGKIDHEVNRIMVSASEKATVILQEHNDELELIAQYLLEREKLSGDEFRAVMRGETLATFTKPSNHDDSDRNKDSKTGSVLKKILNKNTDPLPAE